MRRPWFVLVTSIITILACCSSSLATCYLPTGEAVYTDSPCFPQNPESSCCGGDDYLCATNNMCMHSSGQYYIIGTCTDQTWNSPACPQYCYFRDHIHNSVARCTTDTYCCFDGPECNCTESLNNTHHIPDFLPPYSELVGSSVSLDTMVLTTILATPSGAHPEKEVSTTVSSSSAETSTSASATYMMSTSSTVRRPSTIAPVSAPSKTPTGESDEAKSNNSDSDSKALTIGLAVSLPLAVIIAIFCTVLWLKRPHRKSPLKHVEQTSLQQLWQPEPIPSTGSDAIPQTSIQVVEKPGHPLSPRELESRRTLYEVEGSYVANSPQHIT